MNRIKNRTRNRTNNQIMSKKNPCRHSLRNISTSNLQGSAVHVFTGLTLVAPHTRPSLCRTGPTLATITMITTGTGLALVPPSSDVPP